MRVRLAVAALASVSLFGQAPEIEKIFRARCIGCHGSAQQMSGLRLDRGHAALAGGYSGPVIVPGKSADSKLMHRVTGKAGLMVMPPSGPRLSAGEVEIIAKWIDGGAKWAGSCTVVSANPKSQHWAFQTVRAPA